MLRFLSRRKGRNAQKNSSQIKSGSQRLIPNKSLVQCRVILLDGTDLSIDLSVSDQVLASSGMGMLLFYLSLDQEVFISSPAINRSMLNSWHRNTEHYLLKLVEQNMPLPYNIVAFRKKSVK